MQTAITHTKINTKISAGEKCNFQHLHLTVNTEQEEEKDAKVGDEWSWSAWW